MNEISTEINTGQGVGEGIAPLLEPVSSSADFGGSIRSQVPFLALSFKVDLHTPPSLLLFPELISDTDDHIL